MNRANHSSSCAVHRFGGGPCDCGAFEGNAFPPSISGESGTQALILDQVASGALTVQIAEKQLREIAKLIDAAVAAIELPIAQIRELCGPELHVVPAHLVTMLNMGAGYPRHCQAVLATLHRARNTARRNAKGKHL